MFFYEVLRFQWVLAALGGGLVLLLAAILAYIPVWGPRTRRGREGGTVGPDQTWGEAWHYIPWIVVLTIAATSAYAVIHAIIMQESP